MHCNHVLRNFIRVSASVLFISTLLLADEIVKAPNIDSLFTWKDTVALTPLPSNDGRFATFDYNPPNRTPLKTYWTVYNDFLAGGNTSITSGVVRDSLAGYYYYNLDFDKREPVLTGSGTLHN